MDVGKAPLDEWTVRPYQPGDEMAIVDLYRRAFRKEPAPGYWSWKFKDNPVEIQAVLAFDAAGNLAAHVGGMPVLTKVRDRVLPVSQGVDWMVDPAYRRGLRQGRVITRITDLFFATYGNEAQGALIFGIPIPSLRSILLAHGQEDFQPVSGLIRDLPGDLTPLQWSPRVRPVALEDPQVGAVWEGLAPQFAMATLRDRRHLTWRYGRCPVVTYQCLGVYDRLHRRLEGFAILREEFPGWSFSVLVDWLAPRNRPEVGRELLAACEAQARAWGRSQLMTWFPPESPEAREFIKAGYREMPTPYHLVGSLYTLLLTADWLRQHWYYTPGDTDAF